MRVAAYFDEQLFGIEAVRRGGFVDGFEPRHGATDATHAAAGEYGGSGRPVLEELGQREMNAEWCCHDRLLALAMVPASRARRRASLRRRKFKKEVSRRGDPRRSGRADEA
jgi:hypothetical protein